MDFTKLYQKNEKLIYFLLACLYLLVSAMYPIFNRPRAMTFYFGIFLDDLIPFSPIWIIPYIVWYVYLPLAGLLLWKKSGQSYLKWILTMIIGVVSCFLIYSLFQTTVPRPNFSEVDIFTRLVKIIYANDQPFNCFPSIHVLTTYISILAIQKCEGIGSNLKTAFIITGWLINLSTLFVKQHVVLDMFSAIILGQLLFAQVGLVVEGFYDSLLIKEPS